MSQTLVIAECGSCHDMELVKALGLIDVARECGADCVKFQYWSDAAAFAKRRHAPELESVYRRYQMPPEWLQLLAEKAQVSALEFMCTTYMREDIAAVAPLVRRFKVSSFEAFDIEFIAAHAHYQKDVIISAGMTDSDYARFICACRSGYYHRVLKPKVLHCVSSYPAPADSLNLSVIKEYGFDGFSDHSVPELTWTGALAVAAGAQIIERHIRLDDTREDNPDVPHSMKPKAFKDYVRHIRFAETVTGTPKKEIQPPERPLLKYRTGVL